MLSADGTTRSRRVRVLRRSLAGIACLTVAGLSGCSSDSDTAAPAATTATTSPGPTTGAAATTSPTEETGTDTSAGASAVDDIDATASVNSSPEAPPNTATEISAGVPENDSGEPGEEEADEEGFPFNENPLGDDGVSIKDFPTLRETVAAAASNNKLAVTLYDPSVGGGDWSYFFNGRAVAAVSDEFTILQSVATLTAEGADVLVKQASSDPPGNPLVERADLDDRTPCIITSGFGSFNLTCGGSPNVVVDFIVPPLADPDNIADALAALQERARPVMGAGEQIGAASG